MKFPTTEEEIKIFAQNQEILRELYKIQQAERERKVLDKKRDYAYNKRRERGAKIRLSKTTLSEF